jgi:hypothetical protein
MKQLFASVAALLFACSAQAQIQKGNWVVSTTFPFARQSQTVQTSQANFNRYGGYEYTPQLQVGRFFRDKFALGVQAEYLIQTSFSQFTGGVFARKYWPISPRFTTFLHTDLTYSPNPSASGQNGFSIGLGTQLGFAYFTRKAFAIEAKANFLQLVASYGTFADVRLFRFITNASTLSPSLEVSLAWYLGRRNEESKGAEDERPRIGRGTRAWGGSFTTSVLSLSGEDRNSSFSGLTIGPNYSIFVRDGVALGIALDGSINSNGSSAGNGIVNWSVGVTPYSRYYRMLNESLGVFLQGSLAIQYSSSSLSQQRVWTGGLGVSPGVHYFLGKRWAIEGTAGQVGFSYFQSQIQTTDFTNQPITFQRVFRFSNELGLEGLSVGLKYFVR